MLESRDLTKKFGNKTAVDAVSLKLDAGHLIAMLGPNGSGKTTWMKIAAGLIKQNRGEMLYKETPVGKESKREIAYMATEPFFYTWMTVGDVGIYYRDFFTDFDSNRYEELLRRMELTKDLKVKALSSGMLAKLKIAATMARHAKVYMLDEPFNGIDLLARDEIQKTLLESKTEDTLLLISSHLVEELATIADQAVFMKDGRLVEQIDLAAGGTENEVSVVDRYREIYGHERSVQA